MFGKKQSGNLRGRVRQGTLLSKAGAVVCMATDVAFVKTGMEAAPAA